MAGTAWALEQYPNLEDKVTLGGSIEMVGGRRRISAERRPVFK